MNTHTYHYFFPTLMAYKKCGIRYNHIGHDKDHAAAQYKRQLLEFRSPTYMVGIPICITIR